MRIVVTGGSGKGGKWVVRELREHGHDVLNVDVRHAGGTERSTLVADLTDLGQTQDALSGPMPSSISRRSGARACGRTARPSGSTRCPPTTSSPPPSPTA